MNKKKDKVKTFFIILIAFLIGMYAGIAINYAQIKEKDNKIRSLYVELDDTKEILHREQFNITN